MLVGLGVEPSQADGLVHRYARDARRVLLDARHERDRKLLAIQQRLESELSDADLVVSARDLSILVQSLVPTQPLSLTTGSESSRPPTVVVNHQVIEHVEGVVAQTLHGDVRYGTPADDLLRLISELGGLESFALEDATRQLADPGAPTSTRVTARHRVKSFLVRNANRIESSIYQVVWNWAEGQFGGG
jgi:hypothetical protein